MPFAKFILGIFTPPPLIVALAAPIIIALMIWAFLLDGKSTPLSYAAYALSAYLFAVLCVWVVRNLVPRLHQALKFKNPVIRRAFDDADYRRHLFISSAIAVDTVWAIANIAAADADLQFIAPVITGAVIAAALIIMGIRLIRSSR